MRTTNILSLLFVAILLCNAAVAGLNIALNKPVLANGFYLDAKPENAVDGDTATAWNAGCHPPAWLEIDLKYSYDIDSLTIKIDQEPPGRTVFLAWFFNGDDSMMVARWHGFTKRGTWLLRGFDEPIRNIDRIRICSESSPSWVSFFEVRVIGVVSKKYPKYAQPL